MIRIAVLFLLASIVLWGQDQECRIEGLTYPVVAKQARLTGEVKAAFDVDSNGNAIHLDVGGHPLLHAYIQEALTGLMFAPTCRGRHCGATVRFAFVDDFDAKVDRALVAVSAKRLHRTRTHMLIWTDHEPARQRWEMALAQPKTDQIFD